MITRIWHGRTKTTHLNEYLTYIRETGLKDYLEAPGNLTAKVLTRVDGDICHFWTISEWENIHFIKSFSGDNINKARYYPDDKKFLLELEETVIHCETYIPLERALVIIDMQEGFFNKEKRIYQEELLFININYLIDLFRKKDYPIVFVQHTEYPGGNLEKNSKEWEISSKVDRQANDIYILKTTPDSFYNTKLEENLLSKGVNEIYIAGLQTDFCIDTTCRSAFSKKFNPVLIKDAHSTFNNDFMTSKNIIDYHNNLLEKWFVKLLNTKEVMF